MSPDLFLRLYESYVRPYFEFAISVWSPHLRRDINLIEGVQHRATKLPLNFSHLNYETRLSRLGLTTLSKRRERDDVITTFRILRDDFWDTSNFFTLNEDNRLRGHDSKLKKESFRSSVRQNFLVNRVFDKWNNLSSDIVSAPLNSFKNGLDRCS